MGVVSVGCAEAGLCEVAAAGATGQAFLLCLLLTGFAKTPLQAHPAASAWVEQSVLQEKCSTKRQLTCLKFRTPRTASGHRSLLDRSSQGPLSLEDADSASCRCPSISGAHGVSHRYCGKGTQQTAGL